MGPTGFGGPMGPVGFGGPGGPGGLSDPFGGPMGPSGFGDPFGGPMMGPGGFGDPFGGPMMGPGGFGDPFGGPMMGPGGFGDPFGGPAMGPGGFGDPFGGPMGPGGDYYNEGPVEEYYFEDPSLYEYYVPPGEANYLEKANMKVEVEVEVDLVLRLFLDPIMQTHLTNRESQFLGHLKDLVETILLLVVLFIDTFWGAIGNDTLTGNGGLDIFYFGDNTEGTDTITDFNSSGSDILKFAQPFSGPYTRTSYATDTGATGTVYNIAKKW